MERRQVRHLRAHLPVVGIAEILAQGHARLIHAVRLGQHQVECTLARAQRTRRVRNARCRGRSRLDASVVKLAVGAEELAAEHRAQEDEDARQAQDGREQPARAHDGVERPLQLCECRVLQQRSAHFEQPQIRERGSRHRRYIDRQGDEASAVEEVPIVSQEGPKAEACHFGSQLCQPHDDAHPRRNAENLEFGSALLCPWSGPSPTQHNAVEEDKRRHHRRLQRRLARNTQRQCTQVVGRLLIPVVGRRILLLARGFCKRDLFAAGSAAPLRVPIRLPRARRRRPGTRPVRSAGTAVLAVSHPGGAYRWARLWAQLTAACCCCEHITNVSPWAPRAPHHASGRC